LDLSFDLAFLERKGIKLKNQAYDVLKISKIILPKKKRNFKLLVIAKELGIKVKKCHRALPDAKILKEVFLKIIKRIK